MNVHETRHARGDQIAPHRHTLAYAALALEGSYDELGPDGAWRVEPGDLVVHPPFHLHLNRFERGAARVLNMTLPHALSRALNVAFYQVVRPSDPDRLVRRVESDASEALAEALSASAHRAHREGNDWLDRFASALRADPHHRIGVLARAAGVSAEHAGRAFARRFGLTPAKFRAEQRLRAGLRGLAEGARPLAEIAQAAGYADQAHFTRAIAAATGVAPARLRLSLI